MKTLAKLLFAFLLSPLVSSPVFAQTTFVHLFEWKWNDIASECENFLGPKGYAAVQVSPPQKSVPGSFWWTRYQPVSYAIEGRSGTRAEFASMVARCKAVGVGIYVDAVINHMSAGNRNFPEVPYSATDFHTCTGPINYTNAWQVQNCDLVGLNDLKTESDYVRGKIAAYMNDLLSMGVAGFRIDAAKHMPSGDIANIVSRLNGTPYIFQEVIGAANEPITPAQYTYISDVTEFNFSSTLGTYFKGRAPLKDLRNIGVWSGWLNSSDAVTFVANHDNQRQNTSNIVTHKDGMNINNIAHVFMLAYPYGYPEVMSSYDWTDHDQGPPISTPASNCNNGWLCEHRNREIANMVGFRNATKDAFYLSNWWDNGANAIAFGRGSLGFVVVNGENSTINVTLQTGLAAGNYCNIITGDFVNGTCTGASITVAANGTATFNVAGKSAAAIHVQAKNGSVVGNNCVYSSMKLRGTFNNWVSTDMTCAAGTWVGTANFTGTTGRFKFDAYGNWVNNWGNNNSDLIADASGNDILVTTPGSYTITFNDANLQYSITPANNTNSSASSVAPSSSSAPASSSNANSSTAASVNVSFTCQNGTTYSGQSVYVVGNIAALGNWAAASAVKLNPISYPTWTGTIQLPAHTAVEWKCLKRDVNNAAAGVVWESGSNNTFNTGSTSSTTGAF